MIKSGLSKHKQSRLIEHFVAGTTARTAASLCGVHHNTAAYYFLRLREIIAYELEAESEAIVSGEIEVDESYFGGKRKGKCRAWCCGQSSHTWPVNREARFYAKIIPDASGVTLVPIIKRKDDPSFNRLLRLLERATTRWMSRTSTISDQPFQALCRA